MPPDGSRAPATHASGTALRPPLERRWTLTICSVQPRLWASGQRRIQKGSLEEGDSEWMRSGFVKIICVCVCVTLFVGLFVCVCLFVLCQPEYHRGKIPPPKKRPKIRLMYVQTLEVGF